MSDKKILVGIIITAIVVSCIGGYIYSTQSSGSSKRKVQIGDTIKVDYIGRFAKENEPGFDPGFIDSGKIFDTSITEVATDNINYSKAYSFKPRPSYSPLQFEVGSGKMIVGFEEGVINMTVGEKKTIFVSPDKGYGNEYETLYVKLNTTMNIPIFETMSEIDYKKYYSEDIIEGITMKHYFWPWNVTIWNITEDTVTLRNNAQEYYMKNIMVFGWNTTVIAIHSSEKPPTGVITISNTPTINMLVDKKATSVLANLNENVKNIMDKFTHGNRSVSEIGIVTDVDTDNGTFTINYNSEVLGRTLVFEITLLEIIKK